MYASHIGKSLLQVYNKRTENNYSAQEFFDKEFFPVFYDHPRYLQWITNSPFVQGYRASNPPDATIRQENLSKLHSKVQTTAADASFAIGFPAADLNATTSCQVSNLPLSFDSEDIYASWIGAGLGIGVKGGYVFYVDHPEVLWALFQGWKEYRQLLSQTPNLKSNQIDTWNGHWLYNIFSSAYDPSLPMASFDRRTIEKQKDNTYAIATIGWVKVLFVLMRRFPSQDMIAYVFSLGQTNKTIGFIQLKLKEIQRLHQVYDELFGQSGGLSVSQLEDLYETAFGFEMACENGAVGLKTIEPKQLRDYMPARSGESKLPVYKNEETIVKFNIYQSWLIAMLNNTDLLVLAGSTADSLHKYASVTDRAKTTRSAKVASVLKSANRRQFFEGLTTIIEDDPSSGELFDQVVETLHSIPVDNFPYFLTLAKFKYARLQP